MTDLALVVAASENNVIGREGQLPWHLPADLRHFKATTLGHPIVMGRRTWESIGRPLPGRRNLVLSRQGLAAAEGVEVLPGLDAAIEACADAEQLMVIGGGRLYAEALPRASCVHLTRVHARVDGDVTFPELPQAQWEKLSDEYRPADDDNPYDMSFQLYLRR